jgi:N-carbamoylputrescine amidase
MGVKIGWIQGCSKGSVETNRDYYASECHHLADQGAEIVFLPELMFWDYFPIIESAAFFDAAIGLDDPLIQHFKALARQRRIILTLPFFERRAPGVYHNSCCVISENGEVLDIYRKMHIPDDPGFYEKYYFSPGDLGWKVVKTSKLNIGLLICWDQWFPEAARCTAMAGADLLYYPTAIAWDDKEPSSAVKEEQLESWLTILKSHSVANGCFTLAVNRVGQEGHLNFWGNSMLASPTGKVLNALHVQEKSEIVEINTLQIEKQRRAWPFFRDRRVDAFGGLLSRWGEK